MALAISAGDHKAFKAAPVWAPKLAQRIVLELKDKVAKGFVDGISLEDSGRCFCRHTGFSGQQSGHCGAGVAGVTARAKQRLPFPRSTRHCPWKRSSNWPCAAWQAGVKNAGRNCAVRRKNDAARHERRADSEENNLRPQHLEDYIGQEKVKQNLKIYLEAAKRRGSPWITSCSTARRSGQDHAGRHHR